MIGPPWGSILPGLEDILRKGGEQLHLNKLTHKGHELAGLVREYGPGILDFIRAQKRILGYEIPRMGRDAIHHPAETTRDVFQGIGLGVGSGLAGIASSLDRAMGNDRWARQWDEWRGNLEEHQPESRTGQAAYAGADIAGSVSPGLGELGALADVKNLASAGHPRLAVALALPFLISPSLRGAKGALEDAASRKAARGAEEGFRGAERAIKGGDEALIPIKHYGQGANEVMVDPAYYGTGIKGEEVKRFAAFPEEHTPARSYWYVGDRKPEPGLPVNSVVHAHVRPTDLARGETLKKYADKAREQLQAEGKAAVPPRIMSRAERLLLEDGFKGYEHGGTVAMFRPVYTGKLGEKALDAAWTSSEAGHGWGFTLDPRTGENLAGKDLWSVSPFKDREKVFDHIPSPDEVNQYVYENADKLGRGEHKVGGWGDGGKYYLDVVNPLPDKKAAVRSAAKNDQLAVYHLGSGEERQITDAERAQYSDRAVYSGAPGEWYSPLKRAILSGPNKATG
ncbi:MAG TPA: hypothetical protein VJ997_07825, partial [Longimicrobiales bacterium]|nr:hypothetical protein [Longimicrobiales bacterium]